jgi:hypothetical protein
MGKAEDVSEFLQLVLRARKLERINAVQAASWLDAVGILKDVPQRRGLSLRKLLREGRIQGQLQEPNGRWYILPKLVKKTRRKT